MKKFDLDSYEASESILPLYDSETVALVDTGQREIKRIIIPEKTKLSLYLVTIKYLNSLDVRNLGKTTKTQKISSIKVFFEFIEFFGYKEDSDVPTIVLDEFNQYLRRNKKLLANRAADIIGCINQIFIWYCESDIDTDGNNKITLFYSYILNTPKFSRSNQKSQPSLSSLFSNCQFNDTEIIKSLRVVCCWILLNYERHRKVLLENSDVSMLVNKLESRDLKKPPMLYGLFSSKNKALDYESRKLYSPVIRAIVKSGDYSLIEKVSVDINHPYRKILTYKQMDSLFDKIMNDEGEIRKDLKLEGKRFALSSFQSVSLRDLIAPSPVEMFAMQCLLASERIQHSNLMRLKVSDAVENSKGIQIQHFKARRSSGNKMGTTPIYHKKKLIGAVVKEYLDFLKSAQPYLEKSDRDCFFPFPRSGEKVGRLGLTDTVITKYFNLLVTDGSHNQKALFEDVTENEAKPFLWIVKSIISSNEKVKEQERKTSSQRYRGIDVKRRKVVTSRQVSLNPTFIGLSRVAMDSGNAVQVKGSTDPLPHSDPKTESQLTGHSEYTKNNTYHDRSNAKEKIESDRTFAVQMGELMLIDAQKMGELSKKAEVIDFDECKKLLGCGTSTEDFKSLLEEQGIEIGYVGEILHKDKKIFVATDITAALIIKRISHLKEQMPELLNDAPETRIKALNAAEELVYFQSILKRFPEDIQVSGELLSDQLMFTYAALH